MKHRLLTPGPTPVPEEALLEMARPLTLHRSAEFRQVLAEVQDDLRAVFLTRNPVCLLTASGTGGMEAAVCSSLAPGQKAIVLNSGRWGERWRRLCVAFGVEAVNVAVPDGEAVPPERLAGALTEHPDARAVFATLSETATGVANDIAAYGPLVARTPALFAVDAISGLAVIECRTDDWGIDLCVAGSQKGLMTPPGLALVAVSDKAWRQIDANKAARSFYFDLRRYREALKTGDTPYTPAVTLVKGLRLSLQRIRAEGLEAVWARHARIARGARAGVRGLGLELLARRPADGLTVGVLPAGLDGNALLSRLEKRHGVRLANGQDTLKGKVFRLAHMGYTDPFDVLAALAALELTLPGLGHPVEPGSAVAAAQREWARP